MELICEEISVIEQKFIQSKERYHVDNQKLIDLQINDAKLTLKVLKEEIPKLSDKGYEFKFLSQVVN